MNILGYVVQYFNEDSFLPETGFKHLHKHFNQALESAKARVHDYCNQFQEGLVGPFELLSPTKKQADSDGHVIVFRNAEVQIWIEVIVQ
jgi:hypothetical protein